MTGSATAQTPLTQRAASRKKTTGRSRAAPSMSNDETPANRNSNPRDESRSDDWSDKVRAHRCRQASVAAILDQTFGQFARCSPELWERRAYLMLVGLVYERLATNEDEISTDELVTLAKVLAENRRAEARLRDNHRPKEPTESTPPPTGELPERFADMVRQVYGTNLQTAEGK